MKYIRTKDGIHKVILVSPLGFVRIDKRNGTYPDVFEKDIIKQADTIEELVDAYIYVKGNTKMVFSPGVLNKKDMDFFDAIYGAIFVVGDKGEPILKSVSQMNKEGVLELL